jgi:DNA-binding Lrp family transcriptional regulator
MDALDRKIIILLHRDPRITYRAMSKQLGVSLPTAQRRVENIFSRVEI